MQNINSNSKVKTKDLVETALLISLVYIATRFINIRLPIAASGGLVHMGNVMLFTAAIVFGPKKGAAAGAFGMALFDLLSEWVIWAPFTFVIRGVMGYIIGKIAWSKGRNGNNVLINILAIIVSGVWMLAGYYVAEGTIYGNWIQPMMSMPGDLTQIIIGLIIGIPISTALNKAMKR